ncbi:MAG TPA: type IX secretion system membrane protein PorP/SprF [Anaerovoracaceae bacterium]|nr:type IX secretion system membrane protein PorP/SprF [Anaerovoracaceae bacterium]
MKILKRATLAMLMIMGSLLSKGQQDPMYTQYIFNLQTVNPAYVGYWQTMGLTAISRNQWVGLNGHPTTQTFSFQTPLRSQNVGIGFNVVLDKIGLEKRLSLSFDYSYKVLLSENTSLRFGLKGGFTNYSHNLTEYVQYPDNQSDPLFQATIDSKFMPNVGVGLFLSSPKYFLSLSLPEIIENSYQSNASNYSSKSELRHLFFAGGMMFNLSENVKFKPTFMTRMVTGSPFQYDLSANFLLAEKFWVGGMYRSGDAFGAIAQWIINKKLRLGYAYDFTTSDLRNYQNGVHEIMISFEFVYAKHIIISPRYF